MRGFALLLPLTACGPVKTDTTVLNQVEAAQVRENAEDGRLVCAKADAADLTPSCSVDRSETPDGLVLTVRHPDGAFRRLLVTKDGRGVVAADGAEPATIRILGSDRIEVTIAGERYQLPATVKGAAATR